MHQNGRSVLQDCPNTISKEVSPYFDRQLSLDRKSDPTESHGRSRRLGSDGLSWEKMFYNLYVPCILVFDRRYDHINYSYSYYVILLVYFATLLFCLKRMHPLNI